MKKKNNSKRIFVTFTNRQVELIDEIVKSGELGNSRPQVINFIIVSHLNKNKTD